jgi:exopolysaccharide biosynthesis predicted pyruvyltransferase EpsI
MKQQEIIVDPFVGFLRSRKGLKVYLKPYYGNSGDGLISLGCRELLRQEGLVRTYNPRDANLILWPGGNPTMWKSNLTEWSDCWRKWPDKEFAVGPATFQGWELPWRDQLENCPVKLSGLFARDPVSHQNLLSLKIPDDVQIGLSHDPALHLRNSDWAAEVRAGCTSDYVLAAFRHDHERITPPRDLAMIKAPWPLSSFYVRRRARIDKQAIDCRNSRIMNEASGAAVLFDDVCLRSFDSFVEKVSQASVIHTDRLHTMILAAILEKEIVAYQTAYSKLEQVYEHSMRPWSKVRFSVCE